MAVKFITEEPFGHHSEISTALEEEQPTNRPYFVDDIIFKWDGGYLPFFGSDEKDFENIPGELKEVIADKILFGNIYLVSGSEIKNKDFFEKYFYIDFIDKENFDKFRDFLPNELPHNNSYWFCRYWNGLNGKTLVEFRVYNGENSYLRFTQIGDVTFESVIKKIAAIATNPFDKLDEIV